MGNGLHKPFAAMQQPERSHDDHTALQAQLLQEQQPRLKSTVLHALVWGSGRGQRG